MVLVHQFMGKEQDISPYITHHLSRYDLSGTSENDDEDGSDGTGHSIYQSLTEISLAKKNMDMFGHCLNMFFAPEKWQKTVSSLDSLDPSSDLSGMTYLQGPSRDRREGSCDGGLPLGCHGDGDPGYQVGYRLQLSHQPQSIDPWEFGCHNHERNGEVIEMFPHHQAKKPLNGAFLKWGYRDTPKSSKLDRFQY